MPVIDKDTIRHIAKLARLGLKENEIETFARQIEETLSYINILDSVDTSGVEETSQVTGLINMFADDTIDDSWFDKEELLKASPLPIDQNQIVVKNVFKDE